MDDREVVDGAELKCAGCRPERNRKEDWAKPFEPCGAQLARRCVTKRPLHDGSIPHGDVPFPAVPDYVPPGSRQTGIDVEGARSIHHVV